jgi:hypothetical protein
MSAVWILLGLAAAGALLAVAAWSKDRGRPPDLGFVSHQWLTEHRLSTQAQDNQR